MRKYIDAERLNMEWQTLKPFGVTDTMIENLKWIVDRQPTIEVSEDCISRKWLFNKAECGFDKLGEDYDINHMLRDIKDAPSVVPTNENKCHRHGIRLEDGTPIYECIGCDEVSCDMRGIE